MRIAWLTDIHLNFVEISYRDDFIRRLVQDHEADIVLLGGDVAEAPSVADFLTLLQTGLNLPIYFVLGNHDFYFSSISETRDRIEKQCSDSDKLVYLTRSPTIRLSEHTALVGHDGWADGRCGDFDASDVFLNDYRLIHELSAIDKHERLAEMQRLAGEAAEFLSSQLSDALSNHRHVILLTHVPPFREACWHEGRISDDAWIPHFASQISGERIMAVMQRHPNHRLTVLCGHTHGAGMARIADNITTYTGGAVYGQPAVAGMMLIDSETGEVRYGE